MQVVLLVNLELEAGLVNGLKERSWLGELRAIPIAKSKTNLPNRWERLRDGQSLRCPS